jgi:chromosome segregation ATPase
MLRSTKIFVGTIVVLLCTVGFLVLYIRSQAQHIVELNEQNDRANVKTNYCEKDLRLAMDKISVLEKDVSTLDKSHKDAQTRYNTLSEDKEKMESSMSATRTELEEKIKNTEKSLGDTITKYDATVKENERLIKEANDAKAKLEQQEKDWKIKEQVYQQSEGEWRKKEVSWQVQMKQQGKEIIETPKKKKKTQEEQWIINEKQRILEQHENEQKSKEGWL